MSIYRHKVQYTTVYMYVVETRVKHLLGFFLTGYVVYEYIAVMNLLYFNVTKSNLRVIRLWCLTQISKIIFQFEHQG